jgi:NAD(P)-dependent dehydrogenase (short-subunit alcohol dehydrogenase family)
MPSSSGPSLRVLVTGASRGIGAAIVAELGAQGHRIALTARTEADLAAVAEAVDAPTMVLPADATDPAAPQRLIDAVVAEWGGIDVLVLNAGEAVSAPIERTDEELWNSLLEINLTSPFRFVRAATPVMKAQGFGRMIVVASVASKIGAPYISAYVSAKHGVLGMVRAAAAELATTGITVNAVCPGYVDTPMTQRSVDAIVAKTGRSRELVLGNLESAQPIGRLITAGEVATAVSFLANDSGGINGQSIVIDGGAVQS